jgi:peptidase M48-like protein
LKRQRQAWSDLSFAIVIRYIGHGQMGCEMKRAIVVAVLLGATACQQANAGDSIFNDGHSVEAIRAALKSPIPYEIQRKAQEFDDKVVRSGMVGDQNVEVVTDERYDRAVRIVATLLEAVRGNASQWTIRVLDTNPKIENAFVVGGTYIYVYTGLLDNVQSDDELAFILAHELSHSGLKHNMRGSEDFSNLLASIIELSGALSKSERRREKMGLIGGTIKASYSREDEQEADALAVYVANRANFDPTRGIAFFNRIIRTESANEQENQYQLAKTRQEIEQQMASCSNMRIQWNHDPVFVLREMRK